MPHICVRSSERGARGAILDALREGRTVVYDREHIYGDPAIIQMAAEDGPLPKLALARQDRSLLGLFSGIAGVLGLIALISASNGEWGRSTAQMWS